jgi:hypothetical protein
MRASRSGYGLCAFAMHRRSRSRPWPNGYLSISRFSPEPTDDSWAAIGPPAGDHTVRSDRPSEVRKRSDEARRGHERDRNLARKSLIFRTGRSQFSEWRWGWRCGPAPRSTLHGPLAPQRPRSPPPERAGFDIAGLVGLQPQSSGGRTPGPAQEKFFSSVPRRAIYNTVCARHRRAGNR